MSFEYKNRKSISSLEFYKKIIISFIRNISYYSLSFFYQYRFYVKNIISSFLKDFFYFKELFKNVLKYSFCYIFIFSISADDEVISPSFFESELGYLVASEDTSVLPSFKKIFVLQNQILEIYDEGKEDIILIAPLKKEDILCRLLKEKKFISMTEKINDERTLLFRGPIELETVQVEIKKSEELPIKEIIDDDYIVLKKHGENIIRIRLSKKDNRFYFSKESKFAKFAKEQKKKGLVFYNSKSLKESDVIDFIEKKKEEEIKLAQKKKNIINGALLGYVIFSDGKILSGKMTGQDNSGIIFESGENAEFIKFEQLADMSLPDIIAAGKIFTVKQVLEKINNIGLDTAGMIKKNCDYALEELEEFPVSASENYKKEKTKLAKIAISHIAEIRDLLIKNNLSMYNYKIFPDKFLEWQINNGNILLGDSWIKAEQKCIRCDGSGIIKCVICSSKGRITEKCPYCDNGKVKCSICGGEGWKTCTVCNGNGGFLRRCSRCGGSGYISRFLNRPWLDDIKVIDGKVIIRYRRYPFCYYETIQFCPDCNGSGKIKIICSTCGGSGRLSCPLTEKCKFCNGQGFLIKICPECNGSGIVKCPDCSGKGFIGEEQKPPISN